MDYSSIGAPAVDYRWCQDHPGSCPRHAPGTLGTQYSNVLHPAFVNQFSAQSAVSSPHLTQCMLTDGCALSMTRALHATRSLHRTCTRYTLAQSPTWHCLNTTCTPSKMYDLHPTHNVYLPACTPHDLRFTQCTLIQHELHPKQCTFSSLHSGRPAHHTVSTFQSTLNTTYTSNNVHFPLYTQDDLHPHNVHFSVNTRQDPHPKHCTLSSLRSGRLTPHTGRG